MNLSPSPRRRLVILTAFATLLLLAVTANANAFPNSQKLSDDGSVFQVDTENNRVLRGTPEGKVSVYKSGLNSPSGLAVGLHGTLFVSDTGNHRVIKVDARGKVELIVGTGIQGMSGADGHDPRRIQLSYPSTLRLTPDFLLIADTGNNRVVRVNLREHADFDGGFDSVHIFAGGQGYETYEAGISGLTQAGANAAIAGSQSALVATVRDLNLLATINPQRHDGTLTNNTAWEQRRLAFLSHIGNCPADVQRALIGSYIDRSPGVRYRAMRAGLALAALKAHVEAVRALQRDAL